MDKIVSIEKAFEITQKLKRDKKKIVVAGGVFDVLHIGHIRFLQKAKEKGDSLLILLESDSKARQKDKARPINNQQDRAQLLASLFYVDYVIILGGILSNEKYDELIFKLNPDIIALTKGSSTKKHAKRQALRLGAKVLEVIPRIKNKSTTRIAEIISKSF